MLTHFTARATDGSARKKLSVKRDHHECAVSTLIKWQMHKSLPAFIRNGSASISCSITRLLNAAADLYLYRGGGGQITDKDL